MADAKSWLKNMAKSTKYSSISVLSSIMPNTTQILYDTKSSAEQVKQSITDARTKIKSMNDRMNSGVNSKAKKFFADAMNDIKEGTLSFDKASEGMSDEFDFGFGNFGLDDDTESSGEITPAGPSTTDVAAPIAKASTRAIMESSKLSTELLSKTIVQTNMASTEKLSNLNMVTLNRLNQLGVTTHKYLHTISTNIEKLITFNNENVSVTNQAMLKYMETTQSMMSEIIKMQKSREDAFKKHEYELSSSQKKGNKASSLFKYGWDGSDYMEYVKKNFKDVVPVDMIFGMVDMMKMMGSMGGGKKPIATGFEFLLSSLMPKALKNGLENFDQSLPKYFKRGLKALYNKSQTSSDPLLGALGQIFGIANSKLDKMELGQYYKGALSWDGQSKKALEEVIPERLSKIISLLEKGRSQEIFDYNTGTYIDKSALRRKFKNDFELKVGSSMNGVIGKMQEEIEKLTFNNLSANVSVSKMKGDIQDALSALIKMNLSTSGAGISYRDTDAIDEFFKNTKFDEATVTEVKRFLKNMKSSDLINLEEAKDDITDAINDMVRKISAGNDAELAVYRNLFLNGRDPRKTFESMIANSDVFKAAKMYSDKKDEEKTQVDIKELKNAFNSSSANDNKVVAFAKRQYEALKKLKNDNPITNTMNKFNSLVDTGFGYIDAAMLDLSDLKVPKVKAKAGKDDAKQTARQFLNVSLAGLKDSTNVSGNDKVFDINAKVDPLDSPAQAKAKIEKIMKDDRLDDTNLTPEQKEQIRVNKGFIYMVYKNFLQPFYSNVFGKNGIIGKFLHGDQMKKLTGFLFGKKKGNSFEGGPFSGVANKFLDGVDYFKNMFTGKEYKTRDGKTIKADENSISAKIKKGSGFVYSNTMKYIFGNEYESNEGYQKTFGKMSNMFGKGKEKLTEVLKSEAGSVGPQPNTSGKKGKKRRKDKGKRRSKGGTATEDGAPGSIQSEIANSVSYATETITDTADAVDDMLTNGQSPEQMQQTAQQEIQRSNPWKSRLKNMLGGGLIGAAIPALAGGKMGFLGSLFLPGGPIGGAILGIGSGLLMSNEKVKKFIFGDKEKGKEGVINEQLKSKMKKAMPLIIGGAAVGAIKSIFSMATGIGSSGAGLGIIGNAFLPGGILGAALVGGALAFIKNSSTFQKIAFGKDADRDEDGRIRGGIIGKFFTGAKDKLKSSKDFVLGGIKGAGTGVLTAATIGKMGVIGSLLTPGGLIGGALLGMGIGIAANTKRFQEMLFGKKDENGNATEDDGLLGNFGRLFTSNIITPMKLYFKESMIDAGAFVKRHLRRPFELAVGPIVSSFEDIKETVKDNVKAMFEKIGEGVNSMLQKAFAPIGRLLLRGIGKVFTVSGKLINISAGMTGRILASPLKLMSMMMAPMRAKQEMKFQKQYLGQYITRTKKKWEDRDGFNPENPWIPGARFFGGVKEVWQRGKDVLGFFNRDNDEYYDARQAYADENLKGNVDYFVRRKWKEEDRDEKSNRKALKAEKKIEKYGRKLANKFGGRRDRELTDEEFNEIKKKYGKLGVDTDKIKNSKDMYDVIYNYGKWKNDNDEKVQEEKKQAEAAKENEFRETLWTKLDKISETLSGVVSNTAPESVAQAVADGVDKFDDVNDKEEAERAEDLADVNKARSRTYANQKEAEKDTDDKNDTKTEKKPFGDDWRNESDLMKVVGNIFGGADTLFGPLKLLGGGLAAIGVMSFLQNTFFKDKDVDKYGNFVDYSSGTDAYNAETLTTFASRQTGKFLQFGQRHPIMNLFKNATEKGAKEATETIIEGAAENSDKIIKKAGDEIKENVIKETAENAGEMAAKNADELLNKKTPKIIQKGIDLLKAAVDKLLSSKAAKDILGSKVLKNVGAGFKKAFTAIGKAKNIGKFVSKMSTGIAKASSTLVKVIPVIGWVITAVTTTWDATTGALEAANLFYVDDSRVDWKMRAVSSLMKIFLGFGIGPILDVASEIIADIGGIDLKTQLAMIVYNLMSTEEEKAKLESAQNEYEAEYERYKKETGEELSFNDFNDRRNASVFENMTGDKNRIDKNWETSGSTSHTSKSGTSHNGGGGSYGTGMGATQRAIMQDKIKNTGVSYGNEKAENINTSGIAYGPGGQADVRWARKRYGTFPNGKASTMRDGGCGPTSLAVVRGMLRGGGMTPADMADFSMSNGFNIDGGTSPRFFDEGASALGLNSRQIGGQGLRSSLASGRPVIVSGAGGMAYTPAGHVVTARGLDRDGNTTVYDPRFGSARRMNVNALQRGLTNAWDYSVGYGDTDNIPAGYVTVVGYKDENGKWVSPHDPDNKYALHNEALMQNGSNANYAERDIKFNQTAYFDKRLDPVANEVQNARDALMTQQGERYRSLRAGTATVSNGTTSVKVNEEAGTYSKLDVMNGMIYYAQGDPRWKNYWYGGVDGQINGYNPVTGLPWGEKIGNVGCVITSLAMALSSLAEQDINPMRYAMRWGDKTFNRQNGAEGATAASFTQPINDLGLGPSVYTNDKATIVEALAKRKPVLIFGRSDSMNAPYGAYDPSGKYGGRHAVLATGLTPDGRVMVNDPMSVNPIGPFSVESMMSKLKWARTFEKKDGTGVSENLDVAGIPSEIFNADPARIAELKQINGTTGTGENKSIFSFLSDMLSSIGNRAFEIFYNILFGHDPTSSISGTGIDTSKFGTVYQPDTSLNKYANITSSGSGMYSGFGELSAKFESGKNIGIVAQDTNGASYGKYQFNAKSGTIGKFMEYLAANNSALYQTYFSNADVETSTDVNGSMANAWRAAAAANPTELEDAANRFAYQQYLVPILDHVNMRYGKDLTKTSNSYAIKEALFSTAIQHGVGGAKEVVDNIGSFTDGRSFIQGIYDQRTKRHPDGQPRYLKESAQALELFNYGAQRRTDAEAAKNKRGGMSAIYGKGMGSSVWGAGATAPKQQTRLMKAIYGSPSKTSTRVGTTTVRGSGGATISTFGASNAVHSIDNKMTKIVELLEYIASTKTVTTNNSNNNNKGVYGSGPKGGNSGGRNSTPPMANAGSNPAKSNINDNRLLKLHEQIARGIRV